MRCSLGARELTTGVGRHANANRCDVVVEVGDAQVVATVRDDGISVVPDREANEILGFQGRYMNLIDGTSVRCPL